jgi:hypothetical protein
VIISINNLKAGINWWRNSKFPKDIHNADYYDIYGVRSTGVTEQWWIATVDRLGQWRAYRGRNAPNTRVEITERGVQRLGAVAGQYAKLGASSATEPCIDDLCWEDVTALYAIVSEIKPRSPVFASKMCHFLFPKLFIVMDNLATSVFDYEFYWRGMKDEYHRLKEKTEARNLLTDAIMSDRSGRTLHHQYPLETKIMELSHIGYKDRTSQPDGSTGPGASTGGANP